MKVLSIKEPWASLIRDGVKKIETRSWKTKYRGKLYIHASVAKIPKNDLRRNEFVKLVKDKKLGYGHIIAEAQLVDCVYMDEEFLSKIKNNETEFKCGRYSLGRYAWILEDIKPLSEPIPAKGQLGIWTYND